MSDYYCLSYNFSILKNVLIHYIIVSSLKYKSTYNSLKKLFKPIRLTKLNFLINFLGISYVFKNLNETKYDYILNYGFFYCN